jgi:hypothetical protein
MANIPIYIPTYINSPEYTPVNVQPRLLFFNGMLDCESYYIESASAFGGISREQTAFPYFDNYNVVTGSFPTVNSKSLLFYNEEPVYGELPDESLYSTYWSNYVQLIYNPRTKLLNASAIIPLADYFKMELNDIVEFRSNYYHLRAINDYNIKNGECSIQLLGPILSDSLIIPRFYHERCMGYSITECAAACLDYWTTCGVRLFYEYCMGYSADDCSLACIDAQTCPTTTTSTTTTTAAPSTTTTTVAPIGIEYLVVAGGGASGADAAGGGGGGGLLSGSIVLSPFPTLYTIKVGLGGSTMGANGETSSISFPSASIAIGGGGGGSNQNSGSVGGSGGGNGGSTSFTIDNNIIGQGNRGGAGNGSDGQPRGAGGGGGASQVGGNAFEVGRFQNSYSGGPGGSGSQWLDGNFYAGGGGGGGNGNNFGSGPGGLGGPGGGGNGGNALNAPTGVTGSVNTGGGGGGSFTFKAGGSGIVKLRYFGSGSQAIGGEISYSGSYTYHTFTASGEFYYPSQPARVPLDYLVVAGGGNSSGGGGGAGGFISGSFEMYKFTTSSIIVGEGAPAIGTSASGSNSSLSNPFLVQTAIGGGGGSTYQGQNTQRNGGSGGGGTYLQGPGTGTITQGNNGGNGSEIGGAGGGGGASQAGLSGVAAKGGNGGSGSLWIDGNFYAGGGGGASILPSTFLPGGLGGPGGGGNGGNAQNDNPTGSAGTPNTGGGAGASASSRAGGSGIVKLRYQGPPQATGGIITQVGAYTYHTFISGSSNFTFNQSF